MAVTINATTLAAAVGASDKKITLTSGATVVAGQFAFVDRELMKLQAPVDATAATPVQWHVHRGVGGSQAMPHNSGANVKTGPAYYFQAYDPSGAAVATGVEALPWINVKTGNVFTVTAGAWQQVGTGGVSQGAAVWP